MALHFRTSIRVAPGVRLNFSRSGVSTTIGRRGLSVNTGRRGTYLNAGLPGTGISSRTRIGGGASGAAIGGAAGSGVAGCVGCGGIGLLCLVFAGFCATVAPRGGPSGALPVSIVDSTFSPATGRRFTPPPPR